MKKLNYFFIILAISLIWLNGNSALADPYLEDDFGIWAPVIINAPITKKVKGYFEVNPRIQENGTHINQLLVRPALGYKLNENLSIWQGYGWVTNYLPRFFREQRIWQQILHEKEFPKFTLINRLRLEERFMQNVEGVNLRTRYMLKGIYPIGKRKIWGIVMYDELFINLVSHFGGPQAGIDQNRFFVGLNRKINDNLTVEGGYQMQYINLNGPSIDKLNHIALINLYVSLPQLIHKK